MSFATGAAVFNSCNKAGAVGYFTTHLEKHPCDWKALMWRAQAYNIIGQPQNAAKDIDRAIEVSSGVKRKLAEAEKKKTCGIITIVECIDMYKEITDEHPDCWEAWQNLGYFQKESGDIDSAASSLRNAIDVATENGDSKDPGVCWVNLTLGTMWFRRGELDIAIDYFKAAIDSSPTHTISHINLCRSNLLQGNFSEARQNFSTAIGLNPKLVKEALGYDTFNDYFQNIQQQALAAQAENIKHTQYAQMPAHDPQWDLNETQLGSKSKRGRHIQHTSTSSKVREKHSSARGGNDGGGSGSSSDEDEHSGKDVNEIWKQLQKESPCIKMYMRHKYAQSKCGKYWYSKDTAGHGGAAFKRYDNTRSTLRFRDALDNKMRPMTNKHESREGTVIYKNDMVGVKG